MTEWKLFDGDVPHVSTFAFHEHRERAPHLEQPYHQERLHTAARLARDWGDPLTTLSDLGCGDGGLLSLVEDRFQKAWGYDFAPANVAGWKERGVTAFPRDFTQDRDMTQLGNVVVLTEVLEHLADPHGVLRWLRDSPYTEALVCSSPHNENAQSHDECHAWAWDENGYAAMIEGAGWVIREHVILPTFQVVSAAK